MIRPIHLRAAAAASSRLVSSGPAFPASPIITTITTRFLTTEARTATTTSTIPPPSPSSQTKAASKSNETAPKPKQLTYLVERTASKNLPIYHDARAGGTKRQTLIKKIVGNAQHMKKDIIEELKFKKDDVNVNPVTGQIAIKGYHQQTVKTWLEARGF